MSKIDDLIEKLGDRRIKVRLDASQQLADIGEDAIEPVTNILVENPDYTYRRIAAYILVKIGSEESVEVLTDA